MASPLRQLELFAVDLDDTSDDDDAFSSSSSRAPTVGSSRASVASVDNVKNREKKRRTPLSPREQESQPHLTSDARTFANTIIAFLGSGMLGLPFAFRQCGILLGLATLVFVAAVSTYAMLLVVQCKYKLREQGRRVTTYGEIGHIAAGRVGGLLVDCSLVVSQSSFCIAYLIFIASNAHKFLEVPRELVVAVCAPPLVAFSLLKHMRELAFVALLADVMVLLGLAVVLWKDLAYMELNQSRVEALGALSSVPFFFGVATYCFEGVGMVLPLENSMQHKRNFTPILVSTVVIVTAIYATFGICGYLAFGDATQDVITLNIDGSDGLATIVKLFLCAGLFFTHPVMLFPVFEVLKPLVRVKSGQRGRREGREGSLDRSSGTVEGPVGDQVDETKSALLRATVVLITALIAAGVPNFGRFIAFIGSTCCALLGFVLPALFYLRIYEADAPLSGQRVPWLKKALLYVIMLIGALVFGAGVYDAIASMF
ncbi:hypothetical protein PybrP1_004476 [[Pythium] brassicae (nom. inval.)]|nr:hypothetical protein PybrP1_004476 [[Pythium] brassicae (nom. inval.)]